MTRLDIICGAVASASLLVLIVEMVRSFRRARRVIDEPFAAARDITGRIGDV